LLTTAAVRQAGHLGGAYCCWDDEREAILLLRWLQAMPPLLAWVGCSCSWAGEVTACL
jgi:hypothetical protein